MESVSNTKRVSKYKLLIFKEPWYWEEGSWREGDTRKRVRRPSF